MATSTIEKPSSIGVPEPKTGIRAVLWTPQKDPTAYELPRGSVEMRAFVFAYLDEEAIDITPLSPTGAVIPAFKTLTLHPGLNWVESSALDSACAASAKLGEPYRRPDSAVAIDRLKVAIHQDYDPIAVQQKAGSIVILEPLPKALMTGTLSDYGSAEIAQICAVVNDPIEVESWLTSIASNAANPHPQKVQVERLLKKTLADLNSGNR